MSAYRDVAEAGWRWVVDEVRRDAGLLDGAGVHSGWGGLGLALAEVRRTRPWSDDEAAFAADVVAAVRADVAVTTDATWFDGLPGHLEVLTALGVDGGAQVVRRLLDLATPTGWPTAVVGPPRYLDGVRLNDATLGTAGVLLAAIAAHGQGLEGADELATRAIDVLLAEVEDDGGPAWLMVPERFRTEPQHEMPNFSHGGAGVATALVRAGVAFGRPDLVELAARTAERLVRIADTTDGGFRLPHFIPPIPGLPEVSYGWCHGPSGTAQVFAALGDAGVTDVAGESPQSWHDRCWHSVATSGIPERIRPGFWDNDGRCCGTAGVGVLALDAGHAGLARTLADALVDRAFVEGPHAWWRFVEHRAEEPLLPPGVGWMQGAAGIAAFLFRHDREIASVA